MKNLLLTITAAVLVSGFVALLPSKEVEGLSGIDVSRYQNQIDWRAIAQQDLTFAYMKATEGATHGDTRFCENWASAKTNGITRGAYHFYRANLDARTQFDNFTSLVALQPGDLPPVIDVETTDGVDRAKLIAGLQTWLYLAEIKYGVKPIVYTNLKFYYNHLAGHFEDYPFWIARYGDKAPYLSTKAEIAFWQHSESGKVNGISGPVDLNIFLGTSEELDALCIQEPKSVTFHDSGKIHQ